MNKSKYFIINGDNIVGIVYESPQYGRTLVIRGNINPEYSLDVIEKGTNKKIMCTNMINFLRDMIPQ